MDPRYQASQYGYGRKTTERRALVLTCGKCQHGVEEPFGEVAYGEGAKWAFAAITCVAGVIGTLFRLGFLRRLAWAYFDPGWSRNTFYSHATFIMIPGALMFGFGFALSFVEGDGDSSLGLWLAFLTFLSVIWLFVTLMHPAMFMKPKWIREADRAMATAQEFDHSVRMEILREIGHKTN